jgi:hypothetical protein
VKTVVTGLLLVLAAASTASAQSLLGDSTASPYDPPKRAPFKKHDHLQILVQDPSDASRPEAEIRVRAIAAEVADVRPNGVLVIQAILRRKVNGEDEIFRLTGEAAPEAVVNRAVRSEKLANLGLSYQGRPAAGGLLGKVWPF